jgi:hypothetical protein
MKHKQEKKRPRRTQIFCPKEDGDKQTNLRDEEHKNGEHKDRDELREEGRISEGRSCGCGGSRRRRERNLSDA